MQRPVSGASGRGRLAFLREFLRNPHELGSITPSSQHLAGALLDQIDFRTARRIVELGPGTGVFTHEALRRLSADGALLALDTNQDFIELLRRDCVDPRLTVLPASAERVDQIVAERGWERVDAVISGIPYALLPRRVTSGIVQASWRTLAPGGLFVGYQYSPYLRPFLRRIFGNCAFRLVPRNLPPAFIFVSQKRVPSNPGSPTHVDRR